MIKRILLIFIGVIVLIGIAGFIFLNRLTAVFNNSAGNHEQVLKPDSSAVSKALVVYQPSLSGITEKTAQQIAKGLHDSGYEVVLNNPGKHLSTEVSQFEILVFGSPVYGGNLSPVLLDYIKSIKVLPAQKVIVFDTGSSNTAPELDSAASLISGTNTVIKTKFITNSKDINKKAYDLGKSQAK